MKKHWQVQDMNVSRKTNNLHKEFGNPSEATKRSTGARMGIKVIGKFEPREACILGKSKQWNFNKTVIQSSKVPGECLHLDTNF